GGRVLARRRIRERVGPLTGARVDGGGLLARARAGRRRRRARGRRGGRGRTRAAARLRRARALDDAEDPVVALLLLDGRGDRGRRRRFANLRLRPLRRLVLDLGLGHRRGLVGVAQQIVDAVLLALLAAGRLRRLLRRQHVDQRLVLGGRGALLLRPRLFLEQL